MTVTARRVRRRLDATAHDDSGFTLLEVVVSFVLFSIVAGAATMAISNGIKTSNLTRDRVAAANVAQAAIAQARADKPAVIATPTPAPSTVQNGNHSYTVSQAASVPSASGTTCPVGSVMPFTVKVSWPGDTRTVRVDTVIAC
jgi:prepilin-type N-terminal cleavage/methylation domain-containing protein